MKSTEKSAREPFFQIVKRDNLVWWKAWLIRAAAVVSAFLVCGIVSVILTKRGFGSFYVSLFKGVFQTERRIWNLFQNISLLLCISLAVTPAFKMRFWNIGAEGQALVGALASAAIVVYFGGKVPEALLLVMMFGAAVAASVIWAVIPALFKAQWNTNETLFTLMMNYVAKSLVAYFINVWVTSGSGVLGVLKFGHFPAIGGYAYLLNIIIVAVLTVLVYMYLKKTKHGYEVSVVGESLNTARYVGINVKKVIIRTMVLTGVLCGIAGLLLVAGTSHTVATNTVGGRGFTAILVSWLAKFNPLYMILTSFMVVFLQQGAAQVATDYRLSNAFPDIIIGMFFFFIIACEFFANYSIKFRLAKKEKKA